MADRANSSDGTSGHAAASSPLTSASLGWFFFFVYLAVYGLFVVLNAFWPEVMDIVPLAGLNLALLYGLGLIGLALLLASAYAWLCRRDGAGQTEDRGARRPE